MSDVSLWFRPCIETSYIDIPWILRTLGSVANLALILLIFDRLRFLPESPVVFINDGMGVGITEQTLFHPKVNNPAIKINFGQHVDISPSIKGIEA